MEWSCVLTKLSDLTTPGQCHVPSWWGIFPALGMWGAAPESLPDGPAGQAAQLCCCIKTCFLLLLPVRFFAHLHCWSCWDGSVMPLWFWVSWRYVLELHGSRELSNLEKACKHHCRHKMLAQAVLWVATWPPPPGAAGVKGSRQRALALQAVWCEPVPDEAVERSSSSPALACRMEKLFAKNTPVGIKAAASELENNLLRQGRSCMNTETQVLIIHNHCKNLIWILTAPSALLRGQTFLSKSQQSKLLIWVKWKSCLLKNC